jgi:hypothetical protein
LQPIAISPQNGAANVASNQQIVVRFDQHLDETSVLASMINLFSKDGRSHGVQYEIYNDTITVTPGSQMEPGMKYSFIINKTDYTTGTTIESMTGDELAGDVIISFTVQTQNSTGSSNTMAGTTLGIEAVPSIEDISPSNYVLTTPNIIISFNGEITDERTASDVVQVSAESLDGTFFEPVFSASFSSNRILIVLTEIIPETFYYITFDNEIELDIGHAYIDGTINLVTKPMTSIVPLGTIRYRFGQLNNMITDFDIYAAMIDARGYLNSRISLSDNPDAYRELTKNVVLYTIIERMALEKFSDGGTSITVGNLKVNKTYPNDTFLKFLKSKLSDEIEQTLASTSDIGVAIRSRYLNRQYRRDFSDRRNW